MIKRPYRPEKNHALNKGFNKNIQKLAKQTNKQTKTKTKTKTKQNKKTKQKTEQRVKRPKVYYATKTPISSVHNNETISILGTMIVITDELTISVELNTYASHFSIPFVHNWGLLGPRLNKGTFPKKSSYETSTIPLYTKNNHKSSKTILKIFRFKMVAKYNFS